MMKFRRPQRFSRGGAFNPDKKPEAPLTGKVQDMKAAAGEERLSRTIEKSIKKGIVRSHIFRWTTAPRFTTAFKELDELVFKSNGEVVAISVKGISFVHKGQTAENQDKLNEIIILSKLREQGYSVSRIVSVSDRELSDQKSADKAGKRLGIYR